jgi:hypothetical protein
MTSHAYLSINYFTERESDLFPLTQITWRGALLQFQSSLMENRVGTWYNSVFVTRGCFKKSFTTLGAHINVFRGHVQCSELSWCSKIHRVLPRIVTVQCDFPGNAGGFEKSVQTIHRSTPWPMDCLYASRCRRFRDTHHTVTLEYQHPVFSQMYHWQRNLLVCIQLL